MTVFTDFVRAYTPGVEPDDEELDAVWTALRRVLQQALRRRGMWHHPPIYFGIFGDLFWTTPARRRSGGVPSGSQDALDELTGEVFVELFLERLRHLKAQTSRGKEIDGLIVGMARQFLAERQGRDDPFGNRVFQWLRKALRSLLDRRELFAVSGNPRVSSDTVLAFDPAADPEEADAAALEAEVRKWNQDMLAGWITVRGRGAREVVDELEARVAKLAEAGLEVFRFKTLIDTVKTDLRQQLADFFEDREEGRRIPWEDPFKSLEEASELNALSGCVEQGIERRPVQRRTRDNLYKLWRFLEAFARQASNPESARAEGPEMTDALERQSLPPVRRLSRLLGIHRESIPKLLAHLGEEATRCRDLLRDTPRSAARSIMAEGGSLARLASSFGPEGVVDESRDLKSLLKQAVAEAHRRSPSAATQTGAPSPGDLFHLEACREVGLEWLLLELDARSDRCLMLPADAMGWVGTSDVAVKDESAVGPLLVRCDLELWIPAAALRAEDREGTIATPDLERVRRHRRRIHAGERSRDDDALATDLDVDYRDWHETVEKARDHMVRALGGRSAAEADVLEFERPEERHFGHGLKRHAASLAAVILASLLLTVLLAHRIERQRVDTRIADLVQAQLRLEAEVLALEQPEAAVPWLLAPEGIVRAKVWRLEVPSSARSIVLLLDAGPGDRIEIRDSTSTVWESVVEGEESPDELLLRLPASLLPPGEHTVIVWRGEVRYGEFTVSIERP